MFITYSILFLTVLISFKAFNDSAFFYQLAYSPYDVKHNGKWYKTFTHAFIHADMPHLAFNMFSFWMFGDYMEPLMSEHFGNVGKFYFLLLYFGGVLFSTLLSYIRHQDNSNYVSVGASGAVSAVIFAGIIFVPQMRLAPFLLPFPMPGFIFGFIYLLFEVIMDQKGGNKIAHDAHFTGALFGIIFISSLDFSILKNFINYIQWYFS